MELQRQQAEKEEKKNQEVFRQLDEANQNGDKIYTMKILEAYQNSYEDSINDC